ncbi:hypothetical protein [Dyadobacter sp. CY312]|uniref:hypothetical protein n=1 Tax=Dyadobacter sp. CY312 TaxID=2907303 RepID=UPI001F352601|nr:hypothetical protein [Dyadobacter sp. CY312]MCE7040143.1 hypothetical protein [Dyadobacter sp. CY312]
MKDKYKLTITAENLTIKPYFAYKGKLLIYALLAFLIFCIVPFLRALSYEVRSTAYAIGAVIVLVGIYEFLFKLNVKFLFDRKTSAIYRITPPFFKKRLMSFDEMTIINTSECGDIEYAIGKKKNQFVRNYSISDSFDNGKKSQQREEEYVEQILNPILEFVGKGV